MKSKWVYIVFIVLAVVAITLYISNKSGTIKEELKDFAVPDTGSITQIFMVDKDNHQVKLERKEGYWMVNGTYFARPDAVKTLLETIATVSVKSPVGKAALPNVIKQLATNSVKVEIYKGSEKFKVYYVGSPTQDQLGTYMVLENSSVPFVTFKPGFFGYLSPRYFVEKELWRDNSIFLYSFKDIASVNITYSLQPEKSFTVFNNGDHSFEVKDFKNNLISGVDQQAVKEYIGNYRKVRCESYVADFSQKRLDSLLQTRPIAIISVKNRKGEINTLKLFPRPNFLQFLDGNGEVLPNDPDAMYGVLKGDMQVVVCQYFVFDPLIKQISFFQKMTPV